MCNLLRFLKCIVYTIDYCMGGFYKILRVFVDSAKRKKPVLGCSPVFLDLSGPGFRKVYNLAQLFNLSSNYFLRDLGRVSKCGVSHISNLFIFKSIFFILIFKSHFISDFF